MSLQVFPSQIRGLAYTTVKTQEFNTLVQTAPNKVEARIVQMQNPLWHWELLYEVLYDNPFKTNSSSAYTDLKNMIGFLASIRGTYDDFLYSDPDDNSVGPGIITAGWLRGFPYPLYSIVIASGHAQQVIAVTGNGVTSGATVPAFSTGGGTVVDSGLTWQDLGVVSGTGWPNPQAQLQVVTDGVNYYTPLQINRGGQFYEDVTDLNGAVSAFQNGTASTTYSIGWGGLAVPGQSFAGVYLNWGSSPPTQPVTASFSYYYRVHFEEDKQDFEKFMNQLWTMGGSESRNASSNYLKLANSRIPWWAGNVSAPPIPAAPPVAFPAGAANFSVVYPSTLTVSSGAGVRGFGTGLTGRGAFGVTTLSSVAILSDSPHLSFSGYALPASIPLNSVKAAYLWCPYIHTGGNAGNGAVFLTFHFNSSTAGGITANFADGNFLANQTSNLNPVRIDTIWTGLGNPVSTLPYSSITIEAFLSASISGLYGDNLLCAPLLVVYY